MTLCAVSYTSPYELPHLLFYGPPGTGKTSTILAMAHQLFGPSKFRDRVLELNASDERGIQVIREKVKSFAQRAVGSAGSDGYPCPPFKIVILDEADSMTSDAQTALRRTMETYSHVTRFCIVCNYVSRIIDPLTSRCAKFRFKPLPVAAMKARLARIAEAEGVRLQDDVLAALIESSEGDLRRAIKYLESLFHLCEKGITKHDVFDMSGQVPPSIVVNLLDGILGKNFDDLEKRVANVVADGYAAGQLLSQLLDLSMSHESFSELGVARVAERIAAADQALNDGADDYLQVLLKC